MSGIGTVADVLQARMLAIGCGYPDGNDFDWLGRDPAFKLACGRLPDSGRDLCSQPTISRWENAPTLREIIRLTYTLVDICCQSYLMTWCENNRVEMVQSACGEPQRSLRDKHEEGSDEQTRFHQSEHSGTCSRHDSCR
jgi:hypothetical protein